MSRPKSRRELYSEATRAALLETATAMFAERGFARTSLDDIAVATQVTRGAVYHHFESKQALFEAVFDQLEQDMTAKVGAAARDSQPATPGATGWINSFSAASSSGRAISHSSGETILVRIVGFLLVEMLVGGHEID